MGEGNGHMLMRGRDLLGPAPPLHPARYWVPPAATGSPSSNFFIHSPFFRTTHNGQILADRTITHNVLHYEHKIFSCISIKHKYCLKAIYM
jgi:hypothetical protein